MLKGILDIVAIMLYNFNLLPAVRRQDIPSEVICERHHENIHILFILEVGNLVFRGEKSVKCLSCSNNYHRYEENVIEKCTV
jgi:hypothetical protein